MADLPRLAVVIPCYNSVDTIGEAIESALTQDYGNFGVYVSENGSTDGSAEVVRSFSHPNLFASLHDATIPRTDNWNRAYDAAGTCDYYVNLHSDDRLAPVALKAIAEATRGGAAIIHGRYRIIDFYGNLISERSFPVGYRSTGAEFRELLLMQNIVMVAGVAIRSDVFRDVGKWPAEWTFMQDFEVWWRAGAYGHIQYSADVLGEYRQPKVWGIVPKHAEEFLRWSCQKYEALSEPRYRQALVDGLSLYLRQPKLAELPDDLPADLVVQVHAARALLAAHHPRSKVLMRQRVLRLKLAALSPFRRFSGRLIE